MNIFVGLGTESTCHLKSSDYGQTTKQISLCCFMIFTVMQRYDYEHKHSQNSYQNTTYLSKPLRVSTSRLLYILLIGNS